MEYADSVLHEAMVNAADERIRDRIINNSCDTYFSERPDGDRSSIHEL